MTGAAIASLLVPLPRQRDRDSIVSDAIARQLLLGSPDYPADPQRLRVMYETEYDRGFNPQGVVITGVAARAA